MPFNLEIGKYYVSDTDVSGAGPNYYGYTTAYNSWYIMKETTSGNVKSYTYARGNSSYSVNWTARAALAYNSVPAAFG